MTRENVIDNIEQLLESDKEYIQKQIRKALDSGAIDLEKYDGKMVWPKIIMAAIYSDLEWQYTQKKEWKKDINKLKLFL